MGQCASCGADNQPGARFCNQCGARLEAAPAAADAGYTPRHLREGVLRAAPAQGERKRVTVLFADLKGSTRLAEQAGPELWHQVLDRFFGVLSRAVHRYQGTVNQYTGDGIMALFGAPRALEDHAGSAALAALEMQRELRTLGDELRLAHGLNLSMRVGLNTGEVVVGRIGDDLRTDYTAQGPTVNLAARIEHICEPGRVYLTRSTAELLEGYFELRALGTAQVAGVEEAVAVFELEGERSGRTRLDRSLERAGSPFIGREEEFAVLRAALEDVRQGRGRTVAVIGAAGIGKSRLCHEFTSACEREGIAVARSTGMPYAMNFPMFPIRNLLRQRLHVPEHALPEEARRWVAGALLLQEPGNASLLPAVFDFLGVSEDGKAAPLPDPELLMERLAEGLVCGKEPKILLVEDLHFLDAASEDFLRRLHERARDTATLLLLNHRPEYVPGRSLPSPDVRVEVAALTTPQLQRLALNLLCGSERPGSELQAVAEAIVQRAGGNPFFVEEAVQALASGGWLGGERRAYRLLRPIGDWPVPDTVQALLAARMDRLDEALRSVLQAAAVIGEDFDAGLLAALTGRAPENLEAPLRQLVARGFLSESAAGYSFCHALMQEVAYQGQLESHRRAMHHRLATVLEQRHGDPERPQELALRVAHHWQLAQEWVRAGRWNLVASRWSAVRDIRVAVDQFRRAQAHFDRAPEGEAAWRGRVAARAGLIRVAQFSEIPEAEVERCYAEARALAQEQGDLPGLGEILISYSNEMLHRGHADASADLAAEAIRLCLQHGMPGMVNRFRLGILLSHNASGRLDEGFRLLEEADPGWNTRPIDEENFMSRGLHGLVLGWMGRLEAGRRDLEGAIAFARREDRAASWMYANLVDMALLDGDFAPALGAAEQALLHAQEHGSPFFKAIALRAVGLAMSLNDRHDEALPILAEAEPLVRRGANAHQFEANWLATKALAHAGRGDVAAARVAVRAALDSARASHSRIWELVAWFVWLRLPADAWPAAERPAALARVRSLIARTGAQGFAPWLPLIEAEQLADPAQRAQAQEQARAGFAAIGARGYVNRLLHGEH